MPSPTEPGRSCGSCWQTKAEMLTCCQLCVQWFLWHESRVCVHVCSCVWFLLVFFPRASPPPVCYPETLCVRESRVAALLDLVLTLCPPSFTPHLWRTQTDPGFGVSDEPRRFPGSHDWALLRRARTRDSWEIQGVHIEVEARWLKQEEKLWSCMSTFRVPFLH